MAKKRKQPKAQVPYKFRGLVLDEFQKQAVWYLQKSTSILVCAPTGTGKTLIADYLVDMTLKQGGKLVFTAPIKALVNQKYQEFCRQFGQDQVGIVTGDVSDNKGANLVVMTTEVFRNMLMRQEVDPCIQWVIFDEIHYLDHRERGTVWEEAILLLPKKVGILGLSATVPNASEIAQWIESVHRPIAVVTHTDRAVPLVHLYFSERTQAVSREEVLGGLLSESYDSKGGTVSFDDDIFGRLRRETIASSGHLDLINYVIRNRMLPCLYFVFSRRGCENKAAELARSANFLKPHDKRAVEVTVRRKIQSRGINRDDIPHLAQMQEQWSRGIGVHHAGLLPVVKEIVEELLSRRLLRIMYVTETFAVGVNMPVRCVCFDSLRKFDGQRWRLLTQQEYFQMAGRAGRRGLDRQGTVITLVDGSDLKRSLPPNWEDSDLEPITSKVALTFNTVVNLLARFNSSDIDRLFSKTLAAYQYHGGASTGSEKSKPEPNPVETLKLDLAQKVKLLADLGFIADDQLTAKGETCRGIFVQEVLTTELLFQGVFEGLKPEAICSLLASLVYDSKPGDELKQTRAQEWLPAASVIVDRIRQRDYLNQLESLSLQPQIGQVAADWARGTAMRNILKQYPISEGDFVSVCRKAIDLARQIQAAYPSSPQLRQKLTQCISKLDRDVVQVHL